ncbi:Peptidyl-lysine N-acetyltransferase PatZ [Dirofilaria immitis]
MLCNHYGLKKLRNLPAIGKLIGASNQDDHDQRHHRTNQLGVICPYHSMVQQVPLISIRPQKRRYTSRNAIYSDDILSWHWRFWGLPIFMQ